MERADPASDGVWVTTRCLLAPVVVACVQSVENGKVLARQEGYGIGGSPRRLSDTAYPLESWRREWRPVEAERWSEYRREIDRSLPR